MGRAWARPPFLSALWCLLVASPAIAGDAPVKVFVLAGQSNMEGKAKVSLLDYQSSQPETRAEFEHLKKDGQWVVRDDVWIKFLDRHGNLTVGFGSRDRIGPELEFGQVVGDHFDEQVLLIKTAWGGKSLYRDFRPPGAGLPERAALEKLLGQAQKRKPETTMDEIESSFGFYYRAMLAEISGTLENLESHFPAYAGQGYELAGFVWFQGWNDMINDEYTAEYARNMAHFIRDVRRDLKSPDLPFVIGVLGVGGKGGEPNPKRSRFQEAQAAAGALPEFHGNVAVVHTDQYWDATADAVFKKGWREHLDEWEKVGSDYPYHYLGSAKTYCRIGAAFGRAAMQLAAARAAAAGNVP